jgi:hypothetical protein
MINGFQLTLTSLLDVVRLIENVTDWRHFLTILVTDWGHFIFFKSFTNHFLNQKTSFIMLQET